MKVAFLGFVSAKEEYTDKKSGELMRSVSVAATNQMLKVRLSPEQDFDEMDQVLVAGDIKVSDRNFYIVDPVIRLATAEDRLFLAGKRVEVKQGPGTQDLRALPKQVEGAAGKGVAA